jgi:hypothetical protein
MLVLALPIILADLAQPILSLVDTMVAGHIPGSSIFGIVALSGCCSISFSRPETEERICRYIAGDPRRAQSGENAKGRSTVCDPSCQPAGLNGSE